MKKNTKINKNITKYNCKTLNFCKEKIQSFKKMITSTIIAVQRYKTMDIISASDMNLCIKSLETLYKQLKMIDKNLCFNTTQKKKNEFDDTINLLQKINNELSALFRTTGTQIMEDLIIVSMGPDFYKELLKDNSNNIFKTIREFVHPISYIVIPWKNSNTKTGKTTISKNKIIEDFIIVDTCKNFDCFDLCRTSREFQKKIFGIKTAFHDKTNKKTIIVSGIVDDVLTECISDEYIDDKIKNLIKNKPNEEYFKGSEFDIFIDILTIKELLIYNVDDLYQRFIGYINQTNLIKVKPIAQNVKEFVGGTLFEQRKTLIQLLLKHKNPEFQYLAYLLYDLLSNDINSTIDTVEQTVLFDSLPWNIKKLFREAMKTTINYTKILSNYDYSKIPLEQQICLMKVDDNVKEKAMIKLKEIKAKAEDSGSKARQYLEGLLKIPFGIYKKEPILQYINDIKSIFKSCIEDTKEMGFSIDCSDNITDNITGVELIKYFSKIKNDAITNLQNKTKEKLIHLYTNCKRDILVSNICFINKIIRTNNLTHQKLCHSGKKIKIMKNCITDFINKYDSTPNILNSIKKKYHKSFEKSNIDNIITNIDTVEKKWKIINSSIVEIKHKFDKAIHGHDNAKRQLQRVIGQWMSGENKGYCLGFEGPPGVGKTSLAKKGLVQCLTDENGVGRPFSMIQIGGGSNASTLAGHGFTYVGSQWGRMVDILIETKCMNPIILIDEVDKVSQSENGKEITGILTHIVDETQNESFQDKFFSGINIDLSKALIIFSYNEPEKIDKILLDRIHRIKFENLTLDDKLIISKNYILPEIYKKFGISECIYFDNEILEYIIETYTYESGVRKLKEILYEIIGEINLEILQNNSISFPITMTKELLHNKYLKDKIEVTITKIHPEPKIGLISGLWANSLGKGGIIQIETVYYPSNAPLTLKLTGSLGDVMKESSEVAKNVAWNLSDITTQNLLVDCSNNFKKGIRIHFPEGATPKNGPSAGTAITVAIYSLLNNKKIKNDIAITGEMNLQGNVTAIGGLDIKILGGIRAGVKEFIFPEENKKDLDKFKKKYKNKPEIKDIIFHNVKTIHDVIKLVFI